MDKEALLDTYGYVTVSKYRSKILNSLHGVDVYKTPTQISKDIGISVGHISKVLSDLSKKDLVVCINPQRKKGRLYSLTNNGEEVYNFFKNQQGIDDSEL